MFKTPVFVVFQDCPFCKKTDEEVAALQAKAREAGLEILKLSFADYDGRALAEMGIKENKLRYPFWTDGRIFAQTLEAFIEMKNGEKPTRKKHGRKKKEAHEEVAADVAVQENN